MPPSPLDANELNYLLSLTAKQRRKRERARLRFTPHPGQHAGEFESFLAKYDSDTDWTIRVEDHLIQLVAQADATLLLDHQRDRVRYHP